MKASARGSSQFLQVQRSLLLLIVFTVSLLTLVLSLHLSSITVKLPASPLSDEEEMELPAGPESEERSSGGSDGTYERCLTAYEDTLVGGKFERGRSVWLDPAGVRLVCSLLQPHLAVLEFGSGGSTSLFSQFVRRWSSVEHNRWWAEKVRERLRLDRLGNVEIWTVPTDEPYREGRGDGSEKQFSQYINYPARLAQKYDLILNDGRARVSVGRSVLSNKLLASNSSLLVVHDWERPAYKALVSRLGFRILRQDTNSRRHTACLLPPREYSP